MTNNLEYSASRLVDFSHASREVQRVLEQALALIKDAQAELAALDCASARNALALSREAQDDISNVTYGWVADVDGRCQVLARRIRA